MDKRDNKRNTHRMGRYGYAGKSRADAVRLGATAGVERSLSLIDVMTGQRVVVGVPFKLPTMVSIDVDGNRLGERDESYIVHELRDLGTQAQLRVQTAWTSPAGEWLTVPVQVRKGRRIAAVPT